MAGRSGSRLLITTGTFTCEAKREATRDGAPTIDLIDGERLCDLLKQYELGVQRTIRQVEDMESSGSSTRSCSRDLAMAARSNSHPHRRLHAAG